MDKEDYFYIVDQRKDMIIAGERSRRRLFCFAPAGRPVTSRRGR